MSAILKLEMTLANGIKSAILADQSNLNSIRRFFATGAMGAALCSASITLASAKILWQPAVGAVYKFHWSAQSDDYPGPNGGATIKQEETDTDTVLGVDADGKTDGERVGRSIVIQKRIENVKASMNGEAVPSKAGQVINEKLEYSPQGILVSRSSDDPNDSDNPRLDNVERMIYPDHPVNIGQSWKYHEDANKGKGTNESMATFTFAARERLQDQPVLRINLDYTELGTLLAIRAHGSFWISVEDGEVVKKDIQAEGLTVGAAARTFRLRIRVDRVQ